MKKLIAFAILVVAFILATSSAEARYRISHRYSHHLTWRHFHHHYTHLRHHRHYVRRGSMPGPCYTAASMGGPCGCWAEYVLLGRLDHVWRGVNMWLANDWLRFPRAEPSPGTAAVWPHRHVAPVVAVHNDRTGKAVAITTRESWGLRRVNLVGLVIVQPPVPHRASSPLVRYSSGSLG